MNGRQVQGAFLMVTALGILVIPGILFNNLQNDGLIQPPSNGVYPMTCSSANGGTCILDAQTGCGVSSTYCQLSGSSISFLNACSPFTNILTLNFVGFVSSFFTNCNQSVTQQSSISSGPVGGTGVNPSTSYTIGSCSTLSTPNLVMFAYDLGCGSVSPSIQVTYNGSPETLQGAFGYTMFVYINIGVGGCINGNWLGSVTNSSLGTQGAASSICLRQYVIPSGCLTTSCITAVTMNASCVITGDFPATLYANPVKSMTCTSLVVTTTDVDLQGSGLTNGAAGPFTSSFNGGTILTFLLGLIGVALVLFVGLGLGGSIGGSVIATGGSVGITTNPQGSKLAQTFGIGLLIWAPLYSEFNTWFSSGYLPYGLDGLIGIISIVLIAAFFIGTFLVSQSGTAGSQ